MVSAFLRTMITVTEFVKLVMTWRLLKMYLYIIIFLQVLINLKQKRNKSYLIEIKRYMKINGAIGYHINTVMVLNSLRGFR
ncbi:hypothetical protein A9G49_09370 [Aeromonas sp. ANP5]|nr:hypothetical protein A9G04_09635 [Aeromonas sp. ANNP30]OEC65335.1 hypothetical protein A9G49_09370 [Aeromonas sp. ANP5]